MVIYIDELETIRIQEIDDDDIYSPIGVYDETIKGEGNLLKTFPTGKIEEAIRFGEEYHKKKNGV